MLSAIACAAGRLHGQIHACSQVQLAWMCWCWPCSSTQLAHVRAWLFVNLLLPCICCLPCPARRWRCCCCCDSTAPAERRADAGEVRAHLSVVLPTCLSSAHLSARLPGCLPVRSAADLPTRLPGCLPVRCAARPVCAVVWLSAFLSYCQPVCRAAYLSVLCCVIDRVRADARPHPHWPHPPPLRVEGGAALPLTCCVPTGVAKQRRVVMCGGVEALLLLLLLLLLWSRELRTDVRSCSENTQQKTTTTTRA